MSKENVVRFPAISREDMMRAVREGVRDAFLQVLSDDGSLAVVSARDVFDAVKAGTEAALWRLATSATDMPCADFYEAIKQGAKDGMPR